jgi:hypothetical protein
LCRGLIIGAGITKLRASGNSHFSRERLKAYVNTLIERTPGVKSAANPGACCSARGNGRIGVASAIIDEPGPAARDDTAGNDHARPGSFARSDERRSPVFAHEHALSGARQLADPKPSDVLEAGPRMTSSGRRRGIKLQNGRSPRRYCAVTWTTRFAKKLSPRVKSLFSSPDAVCRISQLACDGGRLKSLPVRRRPLAVVNLRTSFLRQHGPSKVTVKPKVAIQREFCSKTWTV